MRREAPKTFCRSKYAIGCGSKIKFANCARCTVTRKFARRHLSTRNFFHAESVKAPTSSKRKCTPSRTAATAQSRCAPKIPRRSFARGCRINFTPTRDSRNFFISARCSATTDRRRDVCANSINSAWKLWAKKIPPSTPK